MTADDKAFFSSHLCSQTEQPKSRPYQYTHMDIMYNSMSSKREDTLGYQSSPCC